MSKILIVEDDAAITLGLEGAMEEEGFEVMAARTGPEGYRLAIELKPDLVILDLMLPAMSGFEVCKKLRDKKFAAPIIMLTAKSDESEKVLGLELGADDYVTKPFSVRELLARVKAHLRRHPVAINVDSDQITQEEGNEKMIKFEFGRNLVDFKRHEVYKAGKLQEVTNREFKLLEYFIQHPGEVLSRDHLLDKIWGYDVYPTTRTVDNHILRLRKHIEPDPEKPIYIKTIRGAGYLFELNETENIELES